MCAMLRKGSPAAQHPPALTIAPNPDTPLLIPYPFNVRLAWAAAPLPPTSHIPPNTHPTTSYLGDLGHVLARVGLVHGQGAVLCVCGGGGGWGGGAGVTGCVAGGGRVAGSGARLCTGRAVQRHGG